MRVICLRRLAFIPISVLCAWTVPAGAQEPEPAPVAPIEEQVVKNAAGACFQPPPLVRFDEYSGPFQKTVGTFYRTLERKAVHLPHYKPGAILCSLEPRDKFFLFVHDSFDPLAFLTAGFNAGLDQGQNNDPTFGQGAEGYGKRYAAAFAGQTAQRFFSDFAYPAIFSEDPRYYRLAHGTRRQRLIHAVGHTFIAHRDNGRHIFNFSEWLGAATSSALSPTYHPGNERGFGAAAQRAGFEIGTDMGFDVLREFWPEIARKLRMPFRDSGEPAAQ